jgi:hypothetical protein
MQIHEITLTEAGLLQGIKNVATGAVSALTKRRGDVTVAGIDAKTDRASAKKMQAVTDKAVPAWLQYARQLKAANPDPARYATLYKQSLQAFVQKNLMAGQSITNAINRQELLELIDAITKAESDPNQVAQLFPKLVQQAGLSASDPDRQATPLQVRFISISPPVLQFRNKTYVVGDQGKWSEQLSGSIVDQTTQQFFDQQLAQVGVAI